MILCDINVYDYSHRDNGRVVSNYEIKNFKDCIEEAQLVIPPSVGHWFSQHNKECGEHRMMSRLIMVS